MRISDWSSDVCSSDLLGRVAERIDRILRRVQLPALPRGKRTRDVAVAVAGDRARGVRRSQQRLGVDVVGIGEAGFLAGNRAHAHTLFDRMRAVPDDAVLDRPGLAPRMLEIQVAEIRSEEHTSELQSLMRISYA